MGNVSITQLANGTTADATAVDTNFNNIANQLNGNIDATNLAAGAATANLTDASTNPSVLQDSSDRIANYIKPGTGVLAISSGLIGTLSNITYYIAGKRYTITSIPNKTYTISQDCYVYADTTNTITYTAVTNNTASPTPPANSVLVGIMVSNGTAIASINQGSTAATAPVVSSNVLTVCDSLGNLICPQPNQTLIGYRQITSSINNNVNGTIVMTGLSAPIICPTGRKIKVTLFVPGMSVTAAPFGIALLIYNGVIGSGGTQFTSYSHVFQSVNQTDGATVMGAITNPGSTTIQAGWNCGNSQTTTVSASTSAPTFISVELI